MVIPTHSAILLSGIPATGKSTFARYLSREHGFAHYDLECHPLGWPHPELKAVWDNSRYAFVTQLRQYHDRIVLDWGFPVSYLTWVKELQKEGVRLIWFAGDLARARKVFISRGGNKELEIFDQQVTSIQEANYPIPLDCVIVNSLPSSGTFLDLSQIVRMLFE